MRNRDAQRSTSGAHTYHDRAASVGCRSFRSGANGEVEAYKSKSEGNKGDKPIANEWLRICFDYRDFTMSESGLYLSSGFLKFDSIDDLRRNAKQLLDHYQREIDRYSEIL